MTSADFSVIPLVITETSPEPVPYTKCRDKSIFLRSIAAESIPIMSFVGFVPKPYKLNIGMLAYPICHASYPVSVRQYRLLQSRFLQCIPHGKPPCDLLMLQNVTPVHKGLAPSGKFITHSSAFENLFVFLRFFSSFRMGVLMLMLGTHKGYKQAG